MERRTGMNGQSREIPAGPRFAFGRNWQGFLASIGEGHIREAEMSLCGMLECTGMQGKSFLDIGSGSGLFSLAARRLGARVHSFDYDPHSVACTLALKNRYAPGDPLWTIEERSVLDDRYMASLGSFDVVYSWGVLHHTGDMMRALSNAQIPVGKGGILFIAIYNDQGLISRLWKGIKHTYCSGLPGRVATGALFYPYFFARAFAAGMVMHRNPVRYFTEYRKRRGMSLFHDWRDWLGGYPFEVAKPEEIVDFYRERGFVLRRMTTTNRNGNNQFVFGRTGNGGGTS
jgi:2-polyprenyl-6-hydroxyphenyl methylase/3-demethylubiquinone-9 3-methyltransferase